MWCWTLKHTTLKIILTQKQQHCIKIKKDKINIDCNIISWIKKIWIVYIIDLIIFQYQNKLFGRYNGW